MGTVASELESNIEESHKTTSASDLPPVLMLAMMVLMDATMVETKHARSGTVCIICVYRLHYRSMKHIGGKE